MIFREKVMGIGDWGLGIGDWGLGIGDWGLGRLNIQCCFNSSSITNYPLPITHYLRYLNLSYSV